MEWTLWEYMYVFIKDEDNPHTIGILNEAGKLGWDFTGLMEDTGHGTNYLMKRPKGG